ncbi:MAG: hypothetical protein ACI8QZ_003073 [Chlamydiales bacterium]|jgi:hypothetical protein
MHTYLAHITATDIGLGTGLFLAGALCGIWLAIRFGRTVRS